MGGDVSETHKSREMSSALRAPRGNRDIKQVYTKTGFGKLLIFGSLVSRSTLFEFDARTETCRTSCRETAEPRRRSARAPAARPNPFGNTCRKQKKLAQTSERQKDCTSPGDRLSAATNELFVDLSLFNRGHYFQSLRSCDGNSQQLLCGSQL
ncbi:hypothetical protein EVAR_65014_1 [Eumeta japonica]|uniref:Uncharacterized protein n=1 Tax=Eumeta variegata TaxID=151549 RepID=A0A4C2ACA3_EUMVA|nr:hypothetical protein EVAR_65014_1 [Eumeta japonica]